MRSEYDGQGETTMSDKLSLQTRRGFMRIAIASAVTIAAVQIAAIGSADAQPGKAKRADLPKVKPGTNTSFAPLNRSRPAC
jgi:hypothetical protein